MVIELEEIEPIIHRFVKTASEKYHVKQAILFGSYAKGTYREWSDIDIALFVEEDSEELRNISVELRGSAAKIVPKNWDTYIEPHVFSVSLLTADEPFIQEILLTGRTINPADKPAKAVVPTTVWEPSSKRNIVKTMLDDMRAVLGRNSYNQLLGSAALALGETGAETVSSMVGVPMERVLKGISTISTLRQQRCEQ